jgi:hypothetical protein
MYFEKLGYRPVRPEHIFNCDYIMRRAGSGKQN